MRRVRVLVVENETLMRHALRVFVQHAAELEWVGEAANGKEALDQADQLSPDVVLMDIRMPEMNGIEATAAITAKHPQTKVIAVTTLSTTPQITAALKAGASGYLLKDVGPDALVKAIVEVHAGTPALSPSVTRELIASMRGEPAASDPDADLIAAPPLTEREQAIIEWLALGLSNAEIAGKLFVSEATVKANLSKIMQRWGARDRVQVLVQAARRGLVAL